MTWIMQIDFCKMSSVKKTKQKNELKNVLYVKIAELLILRATAAVNLLMKRRRL